MDRNTVWDNRQGKSIKMPLKMEAFLTDLDEVFRKHKMVIGVDDFDDLVVRELFEDIRSEVRPRHVLLPCKDYGPTIDYPALLRQFPTVRRGYIVHDEELCVELDGEDDGVFYRPSTILPWERPVWTAQELCDRHPDVWKRARLIYEREAQMKAGQKD